MKKYQRQINQCPAKTPLINWNTMNADRLIKALVIAAENPDLLRLFLDDLLIKSEIEQCVMRIYAANLLALAMPYTFVRQLTGLSNSTISRISKQICNKKGGYYATLQKLYPRGISYFN